MRRGEEKEEEALKAEDRIEELLLSPAIITE